MFWCSMPAGASRLFIDFRICVYTFHSAALFETVDVTALQSAENAVFQPLVLTVERREQFVYLGTLGVAVGRAGRFNDRHVYL